MIIIIHGISLDLSSHAQTFAFLRVEPDVIIVAPRVEVGQGLLQTLTISRRVNISIQLSIISVHSF